MWHFIHFNNFFFFFSRYPLSDEGRWSNRELLGLTGFYDYDQISNEVWEWMADVITFEPIGKR